MTSREKRLLRLRQNQNGVSFDFLDAVLQDCGFTLRSRRGSHCTYVHPQSATILTIVSGRPLDPVYVRLALRLIDALMPPAS